MNEPSHVPAPRFSLALHAAPRTWGKNWGLLLAWMWGTVAGAQAVVFLLCSECAHPLIHWLLQGCLFCAHPSTRAVVEQGHGLSVMPPTSLENQGSRKKQAEKFNVSVSVEESGGAPRGGTRAGQLGRLPGGGGSLAESCHIGPGNMERQGSDRLEWTGSFSCQLWEHLFSRR